MSIFRRRKADAETAVEAESAVDTEADLDADVDSDSLTEDDVDEVEEIVPDVPVDRSSGPFDATEVTDDDGRLDLGSLRVTGTEGMELRLEVDQEQQQVIAATAVVGESALQLQAFAAPRSGGLWAQIRSEIASSIEGQGGTADLAYSEFGTELRTRMPSAGPDGRTVFAPARFIGVDGPRWFLRGVISGRGAIEDEAAAPLLDIFRETVVVRGSDPMAPRELLPLALPEEEAAALPDAPEGDAGQTPPSTNDLNPFERGPEITEVR